MTVWRFQARPKIAICVSEITETMQAEDEQDRARAR